MVTASAPSAERSASGVASTAEAGEELAALRQVPVAEGIASDQGLRRPRSATQHLVALAEVDLGVLGIGEGDEARVGRKVARRPFPHVAEELVAAEVARAVRVSADGGGGEGALVEVRQLWRGWKITPGIAARRAPFQVPCRRLLPLRLAGQALADPARVRVGLVPADVDHWLGARERYEPAECTLLPRSVRRLPPLRGMAHPGVELPAPPGLRPQLLPPVAAVLHEAQEVAVGGGTAVDPEARHEDLVRRPLVVVGEAAIVGAHHEGPGRNDDLGG